jgi:hypothetical protein
LREDKRIVSKRPSPGEKKKGTNGRLILYRFHEGFCLVGFVQRPIFIFQKKKKTLLKEERWAC